MSIKKVNFKTVAEYAGHDVKPSGSVNLKLKMDYSELVDAIQIFQMISNDITVLVLLPGMKKKDAFSLGVWRYNGFINNHHGETTIKLNSITDNVELDEVTELSLVGEDKFQVMFKSKIELEEEDDDEEDEDDE